ncbi:MAG: aldolase [Candidatus Woesearchaeota archaeon]
MDIPADVPQEKRHEYLNNFLTLTRSTGNLMLFAGDQKIEHLNKDFFGEGIAPEDNDPEHLFRVASEGTVGCFGAQLGLIARYGPHYRGITYLIKMNSKTNLYKEDDPYSSLLYSMEDVMRMKHNGLRIAGVGYTIYLGSRYESRMLSEAAKLITQAHKNGLLAVLWIYPRGKSVTHEKDPHIIAGACGTAVSLGADFVKVNYPQETGKDSGEIFREATTAAGKCGVVCAGGSSSDAQEFLRTLREQVDAGARGSATGRNIHQRPHDEAIRMCDAISAIVLGNKSADEAYAVYSGESTFKL